MDGAQVANTLSNRMVDKKYGREQQINREREGDRWIDDIEHFSIESCLTSWP